VLSTVTIGDVQEMNTMKFSIIAVMFAVVFGIGGMVMSSSAQALPPGYVEMGCRGTDRYVSGPHGWIIYHNSDRCRIP
jgi:hypothetical protein